MENHDMRTEVTNTTLVDCLVVAKGITADEAEQLVAFTGAPVDTERLALSLYNTNGPKWTIRETENGAPLVVGGLVQSGPTRWVSVFIATARAWDEFGLEVTQHTIETLDKLFADQEHLRVETYCLASRKKAQKWYKRVGMKFESELPGYGAGGETAVLFSKVIGAKD